MTQHHDIAVIGGGLLGGAIGYGLASRGLKVVMLDEDDVAFRAARGNFGLVWVQSKGAAYRPYHLWSREASSLWPEFARELHDVGGIDVAPQFDGGFTFCYSEAEFKARAELMHHQFDDDLPLPGAYSMMDRDELLRLIPIIGPNVVGASYCKLDGCANPLRLLRALHASFRRVGGEHKPAHPVETITPRANGFEIRTQNGTTLSADKVVLTAGLGNAKLAPMVGLQTPVSPIRGQMLVTEKCAPLLPRVTHIIRQTDEGGVLIGDSQETAGMDDDTKLGVLGDIAARAVNAFPILGTLRIVRTWSCLRVMTPDGVPLYQHSIQHPGAFAFSVHSGVTLASVHARRIAGAVASGTLPEKLHPFNEARLAV